MPCRAKVPGQLRAELARGKIGETSNLIERLVSWACRNDAIHERSLVNDACAGNQLPGARAVPARRMLTGSRASNFLCVHRFACAAGRDGPRPTNCYFQLI